MASKAQLVTAIDGVMAIDQIQDLFLIFCNEGRTDKVVLGLTDTMYKKRMHTAGSPETLTKVAFREMVKRAPGLAEGLTIDPDFVFLQNLGFTDPKKPKFELNFDQYVDALVELCKNRYAGTDPISAIRLSAMHHLKPLFHSIFGEVDPLAGVMGEDGGAGGGGGDNMSVMTGKTGKSLSRRMSRIVLTTSGTAPITAAAAAAGGPRVALAVEQDPSLSTAAGVASQSSPGLKRRMSMKLASGGSVVGGSGASVIGGSGASVIGGGGGGGGDTGSIVGSLVGGRDNGGLHRSPSYAMPAASRASIASVNSINPFSPEAREGPSPVHHHQQYSPSHAPASPAYAPAAPAAAPEAGGATAAQAAEMKGMIKVLVEVVGELRGELETLKNENNELRAKLRAAGLY